MACSEQEDPTAEFRCDGTGRFNSIDFNYEYQGFRGTINVADSDDMKVRAFIKWVLDKLVVNKDDLRKLTAKQGDITTDGLIRIPTAFRSASKKKNPEETTLDGAHFRKQNSK
ncbi:hypothetical protein ANCCAN_16147 [Ancylostoma caninum]|uniref:Uncharacterized protein n=1 Tax=Ancylostoma caninum TaxID=29170 RepID=A0A368G0I4_ANCCA|nr:hypothetical protein ANCCAN_16147 [Ancylostoma caninum]